MIGAPSGVADGAVKMALILTLENLGGPPVGDELSVSVAYQGAESDPIDLSVPTDGDEVSHLFEASITPGEFRFEVVIDGNSFPFDVVVPSANLVVGDATHEAVADGTIVIDVDISNTGNLVATNVVVAATVETLGEGFTGEARVEAIQPGEAVAVRVPIALPAGDHVVRITVASDSIEVALDDNAEDADFSVAYVQLDYDYAFAVDGYWSDGSANASISATVANSGVRGFDGVAEVSYSCSGATESDDVRTGVFDISLSNGFAPTTESFTLRSSPGSVSCRFISRDGTVEEEFPIPAKIVGISREVWECYSDTQINRHGDIGCAGRQTSTVVKWDTDEPIHVWATGDRKYIEVLWETLGELGPLLGMRFTRADQEEGARLKAYVGVERDDAPADLRSGKCLDAGGCATKSYRSGNVTSAQIGVWTVDSDWVTRVGLIDRWIKHVTLHELLHALVPMGHRDDPLSVVNNINGPDWVEIGEFEEALIRLHIDPLITPGMTMEEVGEVVLTEALLDDPPTATPERSDMDLVRDAYSKLQQAGTARWRVDGGWAGAGGCDHSFGGADLTVADLGGSWARVWRFYSGSDRMYRLYGEDWSRKAAGWVRNPDDFWDDTHFRQGFTSVQDLLVSILYFSDEDDLRVTKRNGETTVRVLLERSIAHPAWARSVTLRGRFTVNDRTGVITDYELDWLFDVISRDSCDRYKIRAWEGEYGVEFEIPDEVYEGTSDENRRKLDERVLGD